MKWESNQICFSSTTLLILFTGNFTLGIHNFASWLTIVVSQFLCLVTADQNCKKIPHLLYTYNTHIPLSLHSFQVKASSTVPSSSWLKLQMFTINKLLVFRWHGTKILNYSHTGLQSPETFPSTLYVYTAQECFSFHPQISSLQAVDTKRRCFL